SRLVLQGNNKSRGEVERAICEGVQWTVVDGPVDFALISQIAEQHGIVTPVLLRVNPGVEVHTHRFNATGNRVSKFGFPQWTGDADRALALIRAHRWLKLAGIHIHIGSLVYSLDNFLTALNEVVPFVLDADPEVFVVGGGLGVRYLNTDVAPTFSEWADSVLSHCRKMGDRCRILAEPGRSMVAPAA